MHYSGCRHQWSSVYAFTDASLSQNTAEFEVPWKDYECVFGLATQDEDDTRASRFFAYKPETTLYLEELVEIVGARPPVISWSDEEELENE